MTEDLEQRLRRAGELEGVENVNHDVVSEDGRVMLSAAEMIEAADRIALLTREREEDVRALLAALAPLFDSDTILCDCVDNSGRHYTSAWLAEQLANIDHAYGKLAALQPGSGET